MNAVLVALDYRIFDNNIVECADVYCELRFTEIVATEACDFYIICVVKSELTAKPEDIEIAAKSSSRCSGAGQECQLSPNGPRIWFYF